MSEKVKTVRRPVMVSLGVPMGTKIRLDYLVRIFEEYRPQVDGLRFKRVSRSVIIRVALAYLAKQAEAGNVGPEALLLAGQDRRAGRRMPSRKKRPDETPVG